MKGIEVRETSIRLAFTYKGERIRRTFQHGGVVLDPTPANVVSAARQLAEIRNKIAHGTFNVHDYWPVDGLPGELTLARQLDVWLGSLRVAPSTLRGYKVAANFWKGAMYSMAKPSAVLGDVPLSALKPSYLLTARSIAGDRNEKTLNNYRQALHCALDLAVADGVLLRNPAGVLPIGEWQRDPPDPFSQAEVEQIITGARGLWPATVANMVDFWLHTGLRTSELLGLRWQHVDLDKRTIEVREATVDGTHRARTKTGTIRTVMLNSVSHRAITAQRDLADPGEFVWTNPATGAAWSEESQFRRPYWSPLLAQLGVRYRRPYNCRHTYATLLLMSGNVNRAWCAKQLGHSIEVFDRFYSRWITGEQDDREMAKLEAWLQPQGAAA